MFIVEGEKSVADFLKSGMDVKTIYATEKWIKERWGEYGSNPINTQQPELVPITEAELKKISALTTPNEVLAVCNIPNYSLNIKDLKDQLTIILDDIKDPGNMGTIIRIADWFGINDIICSEECVDAFNPKAVQATMGSLSRVRIHIADPEELLQSSLEINVYGAMLEGRNIYKTKLEKKGILVIGNESKGISFKLEKYITQKIAIPSFGVNKDSSAESLNAAVATAIICSEFRR